MISSKTLRLVVVAGLALTTVVLVAWAGASAAPPDLGKADRLFDQKHYREAAEAYEAIVDARGEDWHRAAERVAMCRLRLRLYDEAIQAAERYVGLTEGTRQEARAERLTAHLYMLLPHWGTRAGGEFHRGEHRQGVRLHSFQYDKKHAVRHMERARELYRKHDAAGADTEWHEERIECTFDLANLLSRFSIYDDQPQFWFRWWQERDEFLAETAGETDFEEALPYWQMHRKRPIGLRIGPDGRPIFPERPDEYSPDATDDEKILYLLHEARELDHTDNRRHTALSYYRQAMLARKRFGMDRINTYASYYRAGGRMPLQEELEDFNPWELDDSEALVLAGGQLRRVELPEQFDVLGLLRLVSGDYLASGVADQARYAAGVYYQHRQQYTDAIGEYETLRELAPDSPWARSAAQQIGRIKAPQLRLSDTGVQLPGRPAEIQLSYRNLNKVWFVARPVDLAALMEDLHAMEPEDDDKHWRRHHVLANWHHFLVRDRRRDDNVKTVARYLGREVARWAEPVPDDGTHRYAQAIAQSPLEDAGAYLVYAYDKEPPRVHASLKGLDAIGLGASRAALVLTDLALVEKNTEEGELFYVADAVSGAPVPGAGVDVLETWSTYEKRERRWHTRRTELDADRQGMVNFTSTAPGNPQVHVFVTAGDERMAWSGMRYWSRYHPSRMREGLFAYVITDRPVYRPEQTVRLKVWMRRMRNGVLGNMPHARANLVVHNPRGDKVFEVTKRSDEFGGVEAEFALAEEPALGLYRVRVEGERYAGGGSFRVEEYRKPEFEVTVEPDTTHAKLGEKLTAVIRADYYFGAPVTDATVSYKVFREEYTHRYYFPGRWDWLYGPGYGYPWYEYEWFPWWREARCCIVPPPWWWGYNPRSPARELVNQGEAPIGKDGTLEVEIDTTPALKNHPDRDHRYIIKAEVRDPSRRVISGEGEVKVTRQAFYAMIRPDRGYYRPGEEMEITVRCTTPDGEPVQTEGVLTVSRVVFGGPDNAHIEEERLDRWSASTDERGTLTFRLRHEKSDQLKITFTAPDQWGGTVTGRALIWVCGRDFDGRLYRFNDLELITDRRTYRPGDTCHLMINTARPDSYVLFADQVDRGTIRNWRLLHLRDGHAVVDVPVREGNVPNFFVEATTVSNVRVHQ
ncbi:MAG: MG2 domain-containing protein, partial [Candidatus Brocadiia bacterium]